MSKLETYEDEVATITLDRGLDYGHPLEDFTKVNLIAEAIKNCPHPQIKHALYMIGVKMARLAQTPGHLDSIIDIAGYARTMAMILDKQDELASSQAASGLRPDP